MSGECCRRAFISTRSIIRVPYEKKLDSLNTNIIKRSNKPFVQPNESFQVAPLVFSPDELPLISDAPVVHVHPIELSPKKNKCPSESVKLVSPSHSLVPFSMESSNFDNFVPPLPPAPLPLTPKEIKKKDDNERKEMAFLHHRDLMQSFPLEGSSICFLSSISFLQLFIRYVFVDLEFTGLGDDHKITEVGAVKTQGFTPTGDKFNTLVNPQRSVNSYAHKITGYTQKQLSRYPVFSAIYDDLLEFTKNSVLVFHYGRNDIKYLKREVVQAGCLQDPFQSNIVIDTIPALQNILHDGKKSLSAVAEKYGVDTTMRIRHGALLDAEILADVFRAMLQKHGLQIFVPEQWKECQHSHVRSVFETFLSLQNIKVIETLKKYGLTLTLPPECRFAPKAYHLGMGKPCDAIAVDFSGSTKGPCKILMSYCVLQDFRNSFDQTYKKKQMFFGWYEQETIPFMTGPRQTVFVGGLRGALLAKEVLLGSRGQEILRKLGVTDKTFSVLACPSVYLLHTLFFTHETQNIILLVDNFDKHDELLRNSLKECVNKHCVRNFLPLFTVLAQETNLLRFTIKYAGSNWMVVDDKKSSQSRTLVLERNPQHRVTFKIDENSQVVKADGQIVLDPTTHVFVSHAPTVSLRTISFHYEKGGEAALTDKIAHPISHYADRMLQAFDMYSIRDVIFIDRVERARMTYDRAQVITNDSSAYQYFKKRGITCRLPSSFRTAADVYHPWMNRSFEAIIMPLMDVHDRMIGIHQIFFEKDGVPLKIQRSHEGKIPNKVSLGRTVGGITEIYRSYAGEKNQVDVTLISEGGENALVVKDTLDYLENNIPTIYHKIVSHFGSRKVLNIKSCVGINGIVDVPLDQSTHTVVILADNDAANVDAKKTIIDTVRKFLERQVKVHIVLPKSKDNQIRKIDLNDLYIEYPDRKYEEIIRVLLGSVVVQSAEDLGHPEEPLQKSLEKLAKTHLLYNDVFLNGALSKLHNSNKSPHIPLLGTFTKERQPPHRGLHKLTPLTAQCKKVVMKIPPQPDKQTLPEDSSSK